MHDILYLYSLTVKLMKLVFGRNVVSPSYNDYQGLIKFSNLERTQSSFSSNKDLTKLYIVLATMQFLQEH